MTREEAALLVFGSRMVIQMRQRGIGREQLPVYLRAAMDIADDLAAQLGEHATREALRLICPEVLNDFPDTN